MSKVAVTGNNSGTGVFTIAAPNSNTDRTFNLPDETGQLLTDVSDIEPQVKTSLNATGDAPMFACRAFVNFDGTGTVSIRESGNVSSISDQGTGKYQVNFSTEMPDDDFATFALANYVPGSNIGTTVFLDNAPSTTTTSQIVTVALNANYSPRDCTDVSVVVFR